MLPSGADLYVGEVGRLACRLPYFDWRRPLNGRPVAELAIGVASPCVGVPVAAQSQRMIVSCADLYVGEACRFPYFDRRSPLSGCPVAELARAVQSPCVGVPVAAHGQRTIPSGTDLHVGEIRRCVCRFPHFDWRSPVGFRPVAELAIVVVSPCVGVPVAAHSQGKTVVGTFSSADLVEPDAPACVGRGDGGGFPA